MKVVLVQPPQTQLLQPRAYISLGLASIGAVLKEADIEVKLLNLADKEEVQAVPKADWYGITCTTATFEVTKKLVPIFKKQGRVALGGVHPTVQSLETWNETRPYVDVIIRGEAEFAFRDIVKGSASAPFGCIYNAEIIEDLDTLPIPDRQLYSREDVVDYTGIHGQEKGVPATTVITSRGCPYNCNFCCKSHLMFQRYRYRHENLVSRELIKLKQDYGIEHVRFVDDEFTLDKDRTIRLMHKIKSLNITWVCITRADSLDRALIKQMKKAGCVEIHIGVETGSDRLLQLMNKQTKTAVLLHAIKIIKEQGIKVKTYLMYDYPDETDQDRAETIAFIRRAKPDKFTLSRFTPLPGSALFSASSSSWFYPEDAKYVEYKKRLEEACK